MRRGTGHDVAVQYDDDVADDVDHCKQAFGILERDPNSKGALAFSVIEQELPGNTIQAWLALALHAHLIVFAHDQAGGSFVSKGHGGFDLASWTHRANVDRLRRYASRPDSSLKNGQLIQRRPRRSPASQRL